MVEERCRRRRYRRRALEAVPLALGLREHHQPATLGPPRNWLSETGPANQWLKRDTSVPFRMLNVRLGESTRPHQIVCT